MAFLLWAFLFIFLYSNLIIVRSDIFSVIFFYIIAQGTFLCARKESTQKKPCPKTCSLREYPRLSLLLALTQTRFTSFAQTGFRFIQ